MTPDQYRIIRQYLMDKFGEVVIEDRDDFDLGAWRFKVIRNDGKSQILKVDDTYLEDLNANELVASFEKFQVYKMMFNNFGKMVFVGSKGCKIIS